MSIELDIEIISEPSSTSHALLSIGYGNGHIVTQIDGKRAVEDMLAFISSHRAEKADYPHGVSTKAQDKPANPTKHRSAEKSDVEKEFPVEKTGKDPAHHTVVLPKPVTEDVAEKFNQTFPPVK